MIEGRDDLLAPPTPPAPPPPPPSHRYRFDDIVTIGPTSLSYLASTSALRASVSPTTHGLWSIPRAASEKKSVEPRESPDPYSGITAK